MVKKFVGVVSLIGIVYLLLLIPEHEKSSSFKDEQASFAWNQDAVWENLEARFRAARESGCTVSGRTDADFKRIKALTDIAASGSYAPEAEIWRSLEQELFQLAPMIAACPERLEDYINAYCRLRHAVKKQSRNWDMDASATRQCLYRLLYGGRAALEEAMLQAAPEKVPEVIQGDQVPSQTPAHGILGTTLHSGDILVSRGGAPTSALIARGNDYPGNFSHAALAYVDPASGSVSIIESLIECGVTASTLEKYLKGTKLRIMILRLRDDLAQIKADPLLPHKAASAALRAARSRRIPYDFSLDCNDHRKMFCAEVVSTPYEDYGIRLWMGMSHISSPGTRNWLAAFGVTHFKTQEPTDLEYDPQLEVVAEWRKPETLYKDHVDNAVIDALLEGAEAGDRMDYSLWMLPLARLTKFYSLVCNFFGVTGPVPEGMSATKALRNRWFSGKHAAVKARVLVAAEDFKKDHGYVPPYWELLNMARKAYREKNNPRLYI